VNNVQDEVRDWTWTRWGWRNANGLI